MAAADTSHRFRDRTIAFPNGAEGMTVKIETANPVNFHQAITAPEAMTRVRI